VAGWQHGELAQQRWIMARSFLPCEAMSLQSTWMHGFNKV
jgi:hypothetical protein